MSSKFEDAISFIYAYNILGTKHEHLNSNTHSEPRLQFTKVFMIKNYEMSGTRAEWPGGYASYKYSYVKHIISWCVSNKNTTGNTNELYEVWKL